MGPRPRPAGALAALTIWLLGGVTTPMAAQRRAPVREPLPLEVAVTLRSHNGRSSFDLSPDGEWLAHTVQTEERVPRDTLSPLYSATGFPFAEGNARTAASLTHTKTGEVIRLGGAASSSWAAVWSPDGQRVAFYSDEGGEAGLWIWEKATRRATRFPGVVVRPFFGFELARWSADGDRLLLRVLPAGMTIAQANAAGPAATRTTGLFPEVPPGQPSVHVRRAEPNARATPTPDTPTERRAPVGDTRHAQADLAILDLRTRAVARLVERAAVRFYAFSPDGRRVAYTTLKGNEPNTQQPNYDVVVQEIGGSTPRTVATNVRMGYGIEWSWSPDGRTVAYIASGQLGSGEIVLLSVADGAARTLKGDSVPSFNNGEGELAPLWSADGQHLFAIGDGKLWRVRAASGAGAAVGSIPEWQVVAPVTGFGQPTIWSSDGGRTVWVLARGRGNGKSGLFAVDVAAAQTRPGIQDAKSYSGIFNLDASSATGEIAFVSTDQQHLRDAWVFDVRAARARQVSHVNTSLDRYELGNARLIEWRDDEGRTLRGALLLPPGYREGTRVPLIVHVYGGSNGSAYVNRFGLEGDRPMFNMHVLATRGFGVLFPDAPVRVGQTMTDVLKAVMPGVDAAVAQGYADAERLAVMGQSYGSFNTLSIITQTDRFKAAVITAAVLHPDLFTDYLRSTGYYERGQGNMGGTIWEYRDRYFANSPLFSFDRIETPLLIGQGERDGDLIPAEAIFTALQRLNKAVEYRLYQGEGHVITQAVNVIDFWKRRLAFFAEHLDLAYDAKGSVVYDGARARGRGAARP